MIQIWQFGFLVSLVVCGYAISLEKGFKLIEAIASGVMSALWPLVLLIFGWAVVEELCDKGSIRGIVNQRNY